MIVRVLSSIVLFAFTNFNFEFLAHFFFLLGGGGGGRGERENQFAAIFVPFTCVLRADLMELLNF